MPSEHLFPVDQRVFLQTLFGNRDPITADDLSGEELQAIQVAVDANRARTAAGVKGNAGYADYPLAAEAGPGYVPIETFLGRFNYHTLPGGQTLVTDRYDFLNDERQPSVDAYARMPTIERAVMAPLRALRHLGHGFDFKRAAGELGNAFIGRDGREVRVVLPPPVEKARGGLAQFKACDCGG